MRKKRESYVCIDKQTFLNKETGAYQRLDNTAWYLKNRDGKVAAVKLQIQNFLEASNESN